MNYILKKKVNLIKGNDDLFNDALDETNNENVILIKLGTFYFPIYIPIAKYYFKRKAVLPKYTFEKEIRKHDFIYKAIFDRVTHNFLITKDKNAISARYPLWIGEKYFMIFGYNTIYFTSSLYQKLKGKLTFTEMTVSLRDSEVADVRQKLGNNKFNRRVFYPFTNRDPYAKWEFNINNFTIPNANINIKSTGDRKQDIFNCISEKKPNMSEKVKASKDLIEKLQSKELNLLQSLSKKVNIKSLTHAYENFFLYDLENMIKPTFTTEFQKEFNIYGLIYFSGEAKKTNKLHLVRPKNKLKFQFSRNTYKKEIKFELSKVHKKKTFNVVGDYILNFSMLRTEKRGIGQKRKLDFELVDEIPILGIQNSEFNILNPIYVSISSDAIITRLQLYKNYRYRFVLQSLLCSANIENETDVILVTANGLSNAKKALIKKNNQPILESTLGVCFISEIVD